MTIVETLEAGPRGPREFYECARRDRRREETRGHRYRASGIGFNVASDAKSSRPERDNGNPRDKSTSESLGRSVATIKPAAMVNRSVDFDVDFDRPTNFAFPGPPESSKRRLCAEVWANLDPIGAVDFAMFSLAGCIRKYLPESEATAMLLCSTRVAKRLAVHKQSKVDAKSNETGGRPRETARKIPDRGVLEFKR